MGTPLQRMRCRGPRSLTLLITLAVLGIAATAPAFGALDFRQGANQDPALGQIHWVNGILNENNSEYSEGMSVPQRLLLTDIASTTGDVHTLVFHHDATKAGTHAYDFLTSYQQAVASAAAAGIPTTLNPCGAEIGPPQDLGSVCTTLRTGLYSITIPVPDDPFLSKDGATQQRIDAYEALYGDRTITLYANAPITSAQLTIIAHTGSGGQTIGAGGDSGDSQIYYQLTWTSEADQILIEMAGHLAVSGDFPLGWGNGLGSSFVSGGPYHFSLDTLDGASLGSQDNQIKSSAIAFVPPSCVISGPGQSCSGQASLTYTASSNGAATYQWTISGNGVIEGSASGSSVNVTAGASGSFILTVAVQGPAGTQTCSRAVIVGASPVVSSSGAAITCTSGPTVAIHAVSDIAGSTFAWTTTTGSIVSGADTADPVVNAAGIYQVTVTGPDGCSSQSSATVVLNTDPPNVSAGGDLAVSCTQSQATLQGSSTTSGAQFSWIASNGGHIVSGGTTAQPIVNAAGTYTLTVTNPANGCTAADSVDVSGNTTVPDADAGVDGAITCTTSQTTLNGSSATPGAQLLWTAGTGGHIVSGASTANPVVDAPGIYTLTVTDPANGCTATDTVTIADRTTAPNVSAGGDAALTCTTSQLTLNGSSTTPGAQLLWTAGTGGHIVSGASTANPVVDAPGIYTLTVTDPANGCTATDTVTIENRTTAPNVNAGGDANLTCTTSQLTLDGSSATPGAQFLWTAGTGGHIVSGASTANPVVDAPGIYTLTATDPSNGCTATDSVTIGEDITPPTCTLSAPAPLPSCGSTGNTLTVTSDGVSFEWLVTSGNALITSGANTSTITYTAGTSGLSTFQVRVTAANGCTSTCTLTLGCLATGEYCTVTQGFWGSASEHNGKLNGVLGGNLLSCLLSGNPLTVGIPGIRSLTITDAACVMALLPAGGPPAALPDFASGSNGPDRIIGGSSCNTSDPAIEVNKQGRARNVLLGQTVTLALNLRLNPSLGEFILPETLTTVGVEAGPNGTVGEPLECISDGLDENDDTANLDPFECNQVTYSFSGFLVGQTVNDLLALANQALSGNTAVSASEINEAISAINEAFDECRIVGTCPALLGAPQTAFGPLLRSSR